MTSDVRRSSSKSLLVAVAVQNFLFHLDHQDLEIHSLDQGIASDPHTGPDPDPVDGGSEIREKLNICTYHHCLEGFTYIPSGGLGFLPSTVLPDVLTPTNSRLFSGIKGREQPVVNNPNN